MNEQYLIGRVDDTYDNGMYPLVIIDNITKDDLLRCERDEIIIIDLIDNKFFNYKSNKWVHLEIYNKYEDQWIGV